MLTDLQFQAGKKLSGLTQFKKEIDVFFYDKSLLESEIKAYEGQKLRNMAKQQQATNLDRMKLLYLRRNALYHLEEGYLDDLIGLEQLNSQYHEQLDLQKVNPNTETNIKEKLQLLKENYAQISTTRKELSKEYNRITSSGKPFGLEALKRMERDGSFDHNLAHIQRYTTENKDKLQKKRPDLFKNLNGVVDYMKEGDYTKKFETLDEKLKSGKAGLDLDQELNRMKDLTKDRKKQAIVPPKTNLEAVEETTTPIVIEKLPLPHKSPFDALQEQQKFENAFTIGMYGLQQKMRLYGHDFDEEEKERDFQRQMMLMKEKHENEILQKGIVNSMKKRKEDLEFNVLQQDIKLQMMQDFKLMERATESMKPPPPQPTIIIVDNGKLQPNSKRIKKANVNKKKKKKKRKRPKTSTKQLKRSKKESSVLGISVKKSNGSEAKLIQIEENDEAEQIDQISNLTNQSKQFIYRSNLRQILMSRRLMILTKKQLGPFRPFPKLM